MPLPRLADPAIATCTLDENPFWAVASTETVPAVPFAVKVKVAGVTLSEKSAGAAAWMESEACVLTLWPLALAVNVTMAAVAAADEDAAVNISGKATPGSQRERRRGNRDPTWQARHRDGRRTGSGRRCQQQGSRLTGGPRRKLEGGGRKSQRSLRSTAIIVARAAVIASTAGSKTAHQEAAEKKRNCASEKPVEATGRLRHGGSGQKFVGCRADP